MSVFMAICVVVNLAAAAGLMYPIDAWWQRPFHLLGAFGGAMTFL